MPRLLPVLLLLALAADCPAQDLVTVSPRKSFRILQHRNEDWKQVLTFSEGQRSTIVLAEAISWAAQYHISPDDQWILRIQKSGSGDNISILYHVETNARLSPTEEQIGAMGFAFLARQPSLPKDLHHTGIAFVRWDMKAGLLHFTIHGSDADGGRGFARPLAYSLRDHHIVFP